MNLHLIAAKNLDDYIDGCPECLLVDLRPRREYRACHIANAINIPYTEGMKIQLPLDREIILYCERGATSMIAAKQLEEDGYCVSSLAGGIHAYNGKKLVMRTRT